MCSFAQACSDRHRYAALPAHAGVMSNNMKQSKILSAVFLGIFGSACFIFGFFTGDYAAYDEETIKTMIQENNYSMGRVREITDFGNDVYQLKMMLNLQKQNEMENYISAELNSLPRKIEVWEGRLNNDDYKFYSHLIETNLNQAKALLEKTSDS